MMKMRIWVVLSLAISGLQLGGCSTQMIPVMSDVVGQSGEVTQSIATYTSDASVAKEAAVMEALKNRDRQYARMYALSGFQMTFELQELMPGYKALLPKTISFREAPRFDQPLPTAPSAHPVWRTTENIAVALGKYGMIGWGIGEASGLLKSAFEENGHYYNGPVNMENSLNNAGVSQDFAGAGTYQGPVYQAMPEPADESGEELVEEHIDG